MAKRIAGKKKTEKSWKSQSDGWKSTTIRHPVRPLTNCQSSDYSFLHHKNPYRGTERTHREKGGVVAVRAPPENHRQHRRPAMAQAAPATHARALFGICSKWRKKRATCAQSKRRQSKRATCFCLAAHIHARNVQIAHQRLCLGCCPTSSIITIHYTIPGRVSVRPPVDRTGVFVCRARARVSNVKKTR